MTHANSVNTAKTRGSFWGTERQKEALHVLDTLGIAAVLTDLDGRIHGTTGTFLRLGQFDQAELEGVRLRQIVSGLLMDELTDEGLREEVAHCLEDDFGELHSDGALCIVSKTGDLKWVHPHINIIHDEARQPVARLFVLHDITSLHHARQAAKESDLNYRMLVEQANTVVLHVDAGFSIRFVNEYGAGLFGWSQDELSGCSLLETLIPPQDPEGTDLHAVIHEIAAAPELHGDFDQMNRRSDGTWIWIHWAIRAIRNEKGAVSGLLCIGSDITRRKQAELRADRYLRRSRNLADKLLQTEERERSRIAEYLHDQVIQVLSLANIRMGGILDDLQASKCEDEAGRLAGVRHLVEDAVGECRSMMNELVPTLLHEVGLGAALTHLAQQEHVTGDTSIRVNDRLDRQQLPSRLVSLLFQSARELLMNALKYAESSEITITIETEGDFVQLVVTDNGCGFSVEEVYRRIESETGGFGFFNIRERLNGFNGTLTLYSAPGKGTRASIVVPLPDAS